MSNTYFIGWTTGNSGAGVPHQKMAPLVEAIYFVTQWHVVIMVKRKYHYIKCNIFLQSCNFENMVRIMPL